MQNTRSAALKTLAVLFIVSLSVSGCYEGFTGAEGEMLKKYLAPEALKALTENPREDIWLIDVRPAAAYKDGHIPTAKSFPSGQIMDRLSELPREKYLIFYCETGGRAQAVINRLIREGYTRLMNWGGYTRWPYELRMVTK